MIEKYKEKIKSFKEEIITIMKQEEEKEVGLITMATGSKNERSNYRLLARQPTKYVQIEV